MSYFHVNSEKNCSWFYNLLCNSCSYIVQSTFGTPMGKKSGQSKLFADQAWQWTKNQNCSEIGDVEVSTAYRLKLPICKACKRNCQYNPRCLLGLGESYWSTASTKLAYQQELEKNIKEGEAERRKPGELVGLKNLGATCYVNIYLQLWYFNLRFKNAVYMLDTPCRSSPNQSNALSLCDHLQLIFGLLECSISTCVDPAGFIDCLGLATDLQQDAQEFSKLFMGMLEAKPELLPVIQGQFSGLYEYRTECLTCHAVTECPAMFYELDLNIQGNKDLKKCIQEFLKEEMLTGENQYYCDKCQGKQDAVRCIKLKKLPPTLSLQLLRFVYDCSTHQRHKLSTNLTFPDQLNFSDFVTCNKESVFRKDMVYQLSAVLIHRGPSASSGHYIAHILDTTSGNWYKFNDEVVVKMKSGKKLDLGGINEAELLQQPSCKKSKLSKGFHYSKDVYMLVYSRKASEDVPAVTVPNHIQKMVNQHNEAFEASLLQRLESVREKHLEQEETQKMIRRFVEEMQSESNAHEWVTTALIKQYLNPNLVHQIPCPEITSCVHGNLSIESVSSMKYLPLSAANLLYKKFPHAVRNNLKCCRNCVENQCLLLQKKHKLASDASLLNQILTNNTTEGNGNVGFYVGKQSLRKWKSLAQQKIESWHQTGTSSHSEMPSAIDDVVDSSENDDGAIFNGDILCDHGNLSHDGKMYRVVPGSAWQILKEYFSDAVEVTLQTEPCCQCLALLHKKEESILAFKKLAEEQKSDLKWLFLGKNRPCMNLKGLKTKSSLWYEEFYVLSSAFVDKWREFVRQPYNHDAVVEINNKNFLCPHEKLLYDPIELVSPELNSCGNRPNFVLLWSEEWKLIKKHFVVDVAVKLTKVLSSHCAVLLDKLNDTNVLPSENYNDKKSHITSSGKVEKDPSVLIRSSEKIHVEVENCTSFEVSPPSVIYSPELCKDCMAHLAQEEQKQRCKFENADIYIYKCADGQVRFDDISFNNSFGSSSIANSRKTRRCVRGEKKIENVSSNWSVKDLKLKIMSKFSIAPFDQNLYFAGKFIADETSSLESWSMYPDCTVILVEDKPDPENLAVVFEPVVQNEPEKGFKGTALIGSMVI